MLLLGNGGVKRLATTHQPLIGKLGFQLRPLALQLRVEARHDGLLRRHTSANRHCGKLRGVQLPLKCRGSGATLRRTKLACSGLHAANAACVQALQVQPLWATRSKTVLTSRGAEVNRERRNIRACAALQLGGGRQVAITAKLELLCRKPLRGEIRAVNILHAPDGCFTKAGQRTLNPLLRLKGRLCLGGQVLLNVWSVQVHHGGEHFFCWLYIAHVLIAAIALSCTGSRPRPHAGRIKTTAAIRHTAALCVIHALLLRSVCSSHALLCHRLG